MDEKQEIMVLILKGFNERIIGYVEKKERTILVKKAMTISKYFSIQKIVEVSGLMIIPVVVGLDCGNKPVDIEILSEHVILMLKPCQEIKNIYLQKVSNIVI